MEVICQNCSTKLNIPDEKIPENRSVRVACPKCKNKITLDPRSEAPKEQHEGEPEVHGETGKYHLKFIESQKGEGEKEEGYGYDEYSGDEALEFFEEDAKLALLLMPDEDTGAQAQKAAEELGYRCIPSSDTRDATGKMRFHHFDLIMVADGFDGQEVAKSPILNYLNRVSMSVRRRIFLALMSDKFKTMDNMMALALSANVVISTKDIEKLVPILKKSISDNDKFYKVFMDTMTEIGKA
ncbi:MAG: zinc-ribbon domain-containing protein [Deltaproteobacteria bacterium]|nr:zinc-ribbon domain-containing protein [Deltaproteobacteria bacterium]